MNKGKGLLLVISALVCVALGFVVGQVVQATGNQPGSKSDPLVTRSYVEESVGAKLFCDADPVGRVGGSFQLKGMLIFCLPVPAILPKLATVRPAATRRNKKSVSLLPV